jgi:hypothetical protein
MYYDPRGSLRSDAKNSSSAQCTHFPQRNNPGLAFINLGLFVVSQLLFCLSFSLCFLFSFYSFAFPMSPALNHLHKLKRSLTSKGARSKPHNQPTCSESPAVQNVPYVKPINPPPPQSSNFVNTLRTISLEAGRRQYGDIYDIYFYQDKKCRDRAIFLACRLRQSYDVLFPWTPEYAKDDFIVAVCSRLYAYNYILYALPQQSPTRGQFLSTLDQQCQSLKIQGLGNREAVFSMGYCLQKMAGYIDADIVERTRQILEKCLESEDKLSHDERGSMYIFHGMMSGMNWHARDLDVTVEEDPHITQDILQVRLSLLAKPEPYQNPFEDASAIVQEDDDDILFDQEPTHSHKKVDSGFYDGYTDRK